MSKLNVVAEDPRQKRVKLSEMPRGSIGITNDGRVFYATFYSAACLTDPGASYIHRLALVKSDDYVTLYPPGSKITLEVVS